MAMHNIYLLASLCALSTVSALACERSSDEKVEFEQNVKETVPNSQEQQAIFEPPVVTNSNSQGAAVKRDAGQVAE